MLVCVGRVAIFGKPGNGANGRGHIHHIFLLERGDAQQQADPHVTRGQRDASGLWTLVRFCVLDFPRRRLGRSLRRHVSSRFR